MTSRLLFLAAAGTMALAACATSPSGAPKPVNPYLAHAGAATGEFSFTTLYNWTRIDDDRLVLWSRPDRAYLLTLRNSCAELGLVETIALDAFGGRVRSGTDSVIANGLRCRIDAIQPIDLVAMREARRAD
jgi:Family of unknown function (DUF6491)